MCAEIEHIGIVGLNVIPVAGLHGGETVDLGQQGGRRLPFVDLRVAIGKRHAAGAVVGIRRKIFNFDLGHLDGKKAVIHAVIAFVDENETVARGKAGVIAELLEELVVFAVPGLAVADPPVHGNRAGEWKYSIRFFYETAAGEAAVNIDVLQIRRERAIRGAEHVRSVRVGVGVGDGSLFLAADPIGAVVVGVLGGKRVAGEAVVVITRV